MSFCGPPMKAVSETRDTRHHCNWLWRSGSAPATYTDIKVWLTLHTKQNTSHKQHNRKIHSTLKDDNLLQIPSPGNHCFWSGRYTLISRPLLYGSVRFLNPLSGARRYSRRSLYRAEAPEVLSVITTAPGLIAGFTNFSTGRANGAQTGVD